MRRALARAAVLVAALAAPAPVTSRPWYAPDHAKLQLAGNVGFLSPGAGWALGRRTEAELFVGWVPEAVGGADIFSVTGKLGFAPWRVETGAWSFRPLTTTLQLSYTFGERYFVIPPFPFTPTALRAALALGAEASRALGRHRVGLYAELVALDQGLVYWLTNRDALGPADVFSLALGARVSF